MTILRSSLFFMLMIITAFIWSTLSLATFALPYHMRYRFITRWQALMTWLATVICGIRYQVRGREHLPDTPVIIVSNHQSAWETLAFFVIFPPICFALKQELMQIPLFGWALRLLEPIAIDRKQANSALDQLIKQGKQRLDHGHYVVIFPEGKRMPVADLGKFKAGAAALAKTTGYPIVPVYHNAGQYWPRRAWLKQPGLIHVRIGRAITVDEMDVSTINACLRHAIEQLRDAPET